MATREVQPLHHQFLSGPAIAPGPLLTNILVMRLVLASLVLLASLSAAGAAACPSRPDTAATHYNENQLATSLCQHHALDAEVELRQLQSTIEADMRRLQQQIDLQRQMLEAQQSTISAFK